VRTLLRFDLLGLSRTHWEQVEPDPRPDLGLLPQYQGTVDTSGFDASFDLYGGGGLVSTVDDMARFAAALFRGEVFENPATLAAALVVPPAARQSDDRIHSRLAYVMPFGGSLAWGHTGHWGSAMACCPEQDIAVAVTLNQSQPTEPKRHAVLLAALLAEAAGAQTGR
jgi:D-alanyl-D-alanine carboxypeptidase